MRSKKRQSTSWREATSDFSSGPHLLNETLPQQAGVHDPTQDHHPRWGLPSVCPLNTHSPVSASRRSESRYVDPSHDGEFLAGEAPHLRRSAGSVASSCQSAFSLVPSSLRYVGLSPARVFSPLELLGGRSVMRPRPSPASQFAAGMPPRFCVPSPRSRSPRSLPTRTSPALLHPLLKQALLLATAAEVEDRLTICEQEADAFDDILALFSVAKEVEAVRVAAFDMFALEADARRALCAQQKRERRILWCWYLESYNNAVLSQEVRALQLGEGQTAVKQAESLLRSRSTSLQQNSRSLFDSKARQSVASPLQRNDNLIDVEDITAGKPSSPKRHLSYRTSASPSGKMTKAKREAATHNTEPSTYSSCSTPTASPPARMVSSSSRTTESLDLAGERRLPLMDDSDAVFEAALDDRIARQQLLLASGGTSQDGKNKTFSSPLFPTRSAPKRRGF